MKDSKNNIYTLNDLYVNYNYERLSNDTDDYLVFTSDGSVVQGGFQLRQNPRSNCFILR